MKLFALTLALSVLTGNAEAISRYTSTSMACAQVKATVDEDGAAIMRYQSTRGTGVPLYGRYVRDSNFCSSSERAETSYIPTADDAKCPVYECKYYSPDDDLELFGN